MASADGIAACPPTLPSKKDGRVPVWFWDRGSDWCPYEPAASQLLEAAHANSKTASSSSAAAVAGASSAAASAPVQPAVTFGQSCPGLLGYEVDVLAMVQRNLATGTARQVKRRLCRQTSTLVQGIHWEFQEYGTWVAYSKAAAKVLEAATSRGETSVQLPAQPNGQSYKIDMNAMHQTNLSTGFQRAVRRRRGPSYIPQGSNAGVASATTRPSSTAGLPAKKHSGHTSAPAMPVSTASVAVATSATVSEVAATPSSSHAAAAASVDLGFCSAVAVEENSTEECSICLTSLVESSSYDEESTPNAVVELLRCHHLFHFLCLKTFCEHKQEQASGFACPVCKTIHGVHTGTQPPGTMSVQYEQSHHCAGYEDDGLIIIKYAIPSGVQGPEHPNPGNRYSTHGFPRVCFLPHNADGEKILKLLRVAWERRLIFTVGTSSTSGAKDTVTWNEIHHKTEYSGNGSGHGYPDASYFHNVTAELAAQGVTEADLQE
ncbi:probable E3 ubiquitin-protein ligase DTX2 [Sycon ciliatum]|uniref:probable E3 ubiquitin-protein ligase DTX2 n=1 Tax=Sycon ciliatum TaxID=27933 RepID=UPI0031F6814F